MKNTLMTDEKTRKNFWKNGYIIIRDVFSKNQILKFRTFIKKKSEEIVGTDKKDWRKINLEGMKDILSYEELRDSILNKKLLDTVKYLLEDENIYYWGYSRFRYNEKSYRNIHNDAKNDFKNPFDTKYPILRTGVYLQDHKNFSDGLKIFKKSCHAYKFGRAIIKKAFKEKDLRYLLPQRFKSVNIDSQAGDVIIWNLRTCHSANAIRLKFFKNLSFRPFIENFLEKYFSNILLPSEKDRAVIFSNFGTMSDELINFLKDNVKQPAIYNSIKNSDFLNDNILSESNKYGLKILDIDKVITKN